VRLRVKYTIDGKIRFISHLDLMRVFFRACIKSNIPVSLSQGFSPHLMISFGHPLSVGMSGSCEYLDMYMLENVDTKDVKEKLQSGLPVGIEIKDVFEVDRRLPSLSVSINRAKFKIKLPYEHRANIAERIKRIKELDMFKNIKELKFIGEELIMDLPIGQSGNIKPYVVLTNLWPELGPEELKLWHIHREELYNAGNNN
jgi:radical SAM-linked protein